MDAVSIDIDRTKARELYRAYRSHQHYSTPVDQEIQRTYQLIAQGRMVIQALESIKRAGLNDEGFPKLAIARADQKSTTVRVMRDGAMHMCHEDRMWRRASWGNQRDVTLGFSWPAGSFDYERSASKRDGFRDGEAFLPLVPLHLRPKRALQNYHILWEAEWARIVPKDPFLLRRIGKGDLWLVLAAWDLTEVERAALATRVASA